MVNLLKPTNSLINNMYANKKQIAPKVGSGATELMYTDRHASTIVKVLNSKTIVVQRDISTRTDTNGMSETQEYKYEPDPEAGEVTVTLRSNGRWVTRGDRMENGTCWTIGVRDSYHDYSF